MKADMISVTCPDDAVSARYEIERAILDWDDCLLIFGDGQITNLNRDSFELSVEWGKLIFAWWNSESSSSRRITAFSIGAAEVLMQSLRGMTTEKEFLILRNPAKWREIKDQPEISMREHRNAYKELLKRAITCHFDHVVIERAVTGQAVASDGGYSVPGRYIRLVVKLESETALIIGVNKHEAQSDVNNVIAAGIVWLVAYNQNHIKSPAIKLIFCLPVEKSRIVMERLTLIDLSTFDAQIMCFEVDEEAETLAPIRPMSQNELINEHPRELIWPEGSFRDHIWHERIMSMAPDNIEPGRHAYAPRISYSINGLEFASVDSIESCEKIKASFGVCGIRNDEERFRPVTLTESNFAKLRTLVEELLIFRSFTSPNRRHSFYRLRTEAWLESMLRRDIRLLDPTIDDRFVYSQIPAWQGDDRSIIDLLTLTYDGRLVVIEIKAGEDMHLPLQGLDYWIRIEQARVRGEFERRNMFPGITLADAPALLFLVAPRLRFHRTFSLVAGCLSSTIEVYQIGLNTNWREKIEIRSRERLNCE